MLNQPETRVYSAESQVRYLRQVLRDMALNLYRSRYLAYRLTVREVKGGYAKSVLGMLWDLLDPLVLGAIFYFLMRENIINTSGMTMPYSVYVVYGLLLYQLFVQAAINSVEVIRQSQAILGHVKLPPEALILSVFYRTLFSAAFFIVVMVFFSLLSGAISPAGFVKFLVGVPFLILAGMTIGIFLAPFNAVYNDVGRALRIVLMPLRYASPVIFYFPPDSMMDYLNSFNPMSLILVNLRLLAVSDTMAHVPKLAISCGGLFVLGLAGWLIFHLSIPVLSDRA
jgi:lipopolysaccharide transport system permease protein